MAKYDNTINRFVLTDAAIPNPPTAQETEAPQIPSLKELSPTIEHIVDMNAS